MLLDPHMLFNILNISKDYLLEFDWIIPVGEDAQYFRQEHSQAIGCLSFGRIGKIVHDELNDKSQEANRFAGGKFIRFDDFNREFHAVERFWGIQ